MKFETNTRLMVSVIDKMKKGTLTVVILFTHT